MAGEEAQDAPSRSRVGAPRRSAPSPRIQALATRFEGPSRVSPVASSSVIARQSKPIRASATLTSELRTSSLSESPHESKQRSHTGRANVSVVKGALGDMDWSPIETHSRSIVDKESQFQASRDSTSLSVHAPPQHNYPAPAEPVPPSVRQIEAVPVRPLANVSLEMTRLNKAKKIEGLPPTSSTAIPHFLSPLPPPSSSSSLTQTQLSTSSSNRLPPGNSSSETNDDRNGEKDTKSHSTCANETNVQHKAQGKSGTQSHDTFSDMKQAAPIPASEVFKRNALPLQLPDLDAYLSDTSIFAPPKFSTGTELYTDGEALLYGVTCQAPTTSRRNFEVCGDQLSLPPESFIHEGLRKRSKGGQTDRDIENGNAQSEQETLVSSGSSLATLVESTQLQKSRPSLATRLTYSSGSPSSTKSRPNKRLAMFPPLMLLRENSLDELKSNAVGPRKPPGGFLGALPGIGSLLGTLLDFVVGVEGSSLAAGIFRLQLFMDFVQIMNLNLHFNSAVRSIDDVGSNHTGRTGADRVLLHIVPSLMALDFVSVFGAALIVFFALLGVVALLLLSFWRMVRRYNPNRALEGFDSQPWLFRPVAARRSSPRRAKPQPDQNVKAWKSTVWTKFANVSIVMLLTVLYIPLSKLAVDALVWNVDYWPAEASISTESAFCYKTSLDPTAFNWAYVIIPVASVTVVLYTLWFPYQMMQSIRKLLPRVNAFNELGNRRTQGEMETEYMRLLTHDGSPLNFMYNAYRRRWGTYKPLYILCFKLSNLLIISVFTQQNCLFRHVEVKRMLIIQQGTLIGLQTLLLIGHLYVQPFTDMLSNRSELVSRCGYVLTAALGLLVALQVQGSTVYRSGLLYTVQALTYSGNLYFSLAGTRWMSHWMKRLQGRMDFSIDVFAPFLQLDKHIKRRIWQETLSTLLLSAPEYRMSVGQTVTFSITDEGPPYLLQFQGTAAERHVENLKILKTVGMERYKGAADMLRESDEHSHSGAQRWKTVIHRIQSHFAGPDAYWQPIRNGEHGDTASKALRGVTSYFGKAFLIPFPPTLVIRYDQTDDGTDANIGRDDSAVQLTTLAELEAFVWQNESKAVQQRRWVRAVLRSLDGQRVVCPYVHAVKETSQGRLQACISGLHSSSSAYTLAKPILYEEGTLTVQRSLAPDAVVDDYNFAPGFDVFVTYTQGVRRDADGLSVDRTRLTIDAVAAFGLRDDFTYSAGVERLLRDNAATIDVRLPRIWQILQSYRTRFHREATEKAKTLSYSFLPDVFDQPMWNHKDVRHAFQNSHGCCSAVRHLPDRYRAACTTLVERMAHVQQSRVHKWWYIFWDDFWRHNNSDYAVLRSHRQTFNPHFPTSIAYTPLPRARLEALLRSKAGMWVDEDEERRKNKSNKRGGGLITVGLVNRIYFVLDEMVFDSSLKRSGERQPGTDRGHALLVGTLASDGQIAVRPMAAFADSLQEQNQSQQQTSPRELFSVPMYEDPFATSSRHTGGGTDEDHDSIIERYAWPWTEQRLSGRPSQRRWKRLRGRLLEWLSIRPYKLHSDIEQLYIYLCIVDGRYEAAPSSALMHA